MSSFVTRLRAALTDERQPGESVRVSKSDLRDLLFHFDRLDREARAQCQQRKSAYDARDDIFRGAIKPETWERMKAERGR